ncbi:unnamed protein product [Effrenium voratum]|nr:unnamed protein product [Effrenium voratum]
MCLEEMLHQAVEASVEAPTRALRRRIRQRLHKRLGAMLSLEEFERSMERFKAMETEKTSHATHVAHAAEKTDMRAVPCLHVCLVPMPLMMPLSKVQKAQPVAASTVIDELGGASGWESTVALGTPHLPVERTFIHFDTRMHVRRRSRSV